MTQEEKDIRLKALNQICMNCISAAAKRFETITPKFCMYCKTGIEIHKLENPDWDKIDWNSSRWEDLYRH